MAEASIEDSSELAEVPRPFDQRIGRTWTGPSYSFFRSTRQTRAGLVVGADGSNINLYNIKTSKLLASHTFRPQSRILAQPCALTVKRKRHPWRTFVYAAVRNDSIAGDDQVVCFTQHLPGSSTLSELPDSAKTAISIGSKEDPVVHVEPVSGRAEGKKHAFSLLIFQRNGLLTSVSSDLQEHKWSVMLDLQQINSDHGHVKTAGAISAAFTYPAQHSEQDALNGPSTLTYNASSGPSTHRRSRSDISLGIIFRSSNFQNAVASEDCLKTFAISLASSSPHTKPKVQTMDCKQIPRPSQTLSQNLIEYTMDWKKALLIQKCPSSSRIIDLNSRPLKVVYSFNSDTEGNTDCALINRSTILLMTQARCSLINLKYGTIYFQKSFETSETGITSKKRKRSNSTPSQARLSPIRYFNKIGCIAGLQGASLCSARLNLRSDGKGVKRLKVGRLADAFGHGNHSSKSNSVAFLDRSLNEVPKVFTYNKVSEGSGDDLPSCLQIQGLDHDKFRKMASSGWLHPKRVQQAMSAQLELSVPARDVSSRDIVNAIARYDRSLVLVAELVFSSPNLEPEVLTHALRVLVRSFEAKRPPAESDRILKDVTNLTNGDLDHELQVEEGHAANELQLASELLEGGFEVRTSALRTCLEKLATCYKAKQVSEAFKSSLSSHELVLLLEVLRHELHEGGWTQHTLDYGLDPRPAETQANAVTAIASLVTCAINALGTGAFLSNHEIAGKDETLSFITSLRNETSAVLEGIQESSFFDGFLKDFLRYEVTLNDPSSSRFHAKNRKSKKKLNEYVSTLALPAALPIGTKPIEKVSMTHIGIGGEIVKRSLKEIGGQIDQQVGRYSFEKIRLD